MVADTSVYKYHVVCNDSCRGLGYLAAIMGLEDVLASRCIPIPMRRTDKKMPSFPADFEGATLRHQFYTLALTHFQPV